MILMGENMNENAVQSLEEKICFLEAANQELSDEILHQKSEIKILQNMQKNLLHRLENLEHAGNKTQSLDQNEIPPHY
tara:strand:+ start:1111 stop:1344 length:234 start_codon:yes stop_codon:yes gene_type:complete